MQNKHQAGRRRPTSIDGMSRPRSPRSSGSIDLNRPKSYQPSRKIGDFKAADGFRPAGQNVINTTIDSDFLRPEKKKRFSRGRRQPRLDGDHWQKKQVRRKRTLKLAIVFSMLAIITTGSFLGAKGYLNLRKVLDGAGGAAALQEDVDPALLKGEGDGRINVLVTGRGGAQHEAPDLTDTIIVASIDPITKEAGLISIPRDLYVTVPDTGSMKINSVFFTGKMRYLSQNPDGSKQTLKKAEEEGLKLLDKTVSEVLGIPVHYHAIVDFTGFKNAVDTVGGIDLKVPTRVQEQMRIDGKPYFLDVKPGQQHFDGFKALAYSRSRYTSARGDFERSERQRLVILALKEKVFSAGTYSNPLKISGLMDDLGGHIQTNFSVDDIRRMYDISKSIGPGTTISLGLVDPPNNFVTTSNVGGLSVVIPSAGLGNYSEIHNYVRNMLRDSFIRKENPRIVVLNGTQTEGAATEKANELRSYGYNVVRVDNAPKRNYTKNILVDLRNGKNKYTKRYLELRLQSQAINALPDGSIDANDADFVIIVGQNG